ncbi:MAG: pentapeptide repeat-containing protein, partial [Trichormus sp.]
NLDLRGLNLRGANLADASFVNTDLSEANLHDAHLSGAKLINTRLSGTNFTLAKMNGAYIQNCELTPETNLTGVDCDYIYTRLPTQDNPDPYRQPRVDGRRFKPGELNQLLLSFSTQGTPQGELHNVDTMQRTQQNFKK